MRVWPVLVFPALAAGLIAACGGSDSSLFTGDGGVGGDGTTTRDGPIALGDVTLGGGDSTTGGPCTPKTCAQLGYDCGKNGDGCGNIIDCGSCTPPEFCGAGGFSKCGGNLSALDGGNSCTPRTCQQMGFNCGPAGDGCGGLIMTCGSCSSPDICGGGGQPGVCGDSVSDAGQQCTNLCLQQVQCEGGVTTTISGTVYAPTNPANGYGNPDPLYDALVYIPNAPVQPFPQGISCDVCGAQASGSPLVSVVTGPDGKFTLTNAPVGSNIPLVIQLGKWRRQITIPTVNACVDNPLTPDQTRLPRNKTEGDIPLMAIVTGSADPIECVLPKIGIDLTEFTDPPGGGRIQFYQADSPGAGAVISGNTPLEDQLWASSQSIGAYDLVIFDCEGSEYDETGGPLSTILNYANSGGRVFASHFSYVWTFTNGPWATTAAWNVNQPAPGGGLSPITAFVDTSFQKGQDFATWLGIVGALSQTNPPAIMVDQPRRDQDGANVPPSQRFLRGDPNAGASDMEFTFNTPISPPMGQPQCGRVLFSDFHVNTGGAGAGTFPGECPVAPMTPQEKVLEFMLFDLTSCVQQMNGGPTCTPLTCQQQGFNCGPAGDGCGNLLQCGTCTPPQMCGAGGQPGVCGYVDAGSCTPMTCQQQNINCGPAGDGCGNLLQCGTCVAPQTCGGGGVAGQCGGGNK